MTAPNDKPSKPRRTHQLVRLQSNGQYWTAFCYGHPARSLGNKANIPKSKALSLCRELEFQLRRQEMGDFAASPTQPAGEAVASRPRAPRLSKWLEHYAAQRTELAHATKTINRFTMKYLRKHFDNDPPIDAIDRRQAAEWREALAAGTLSQENEVHSAAPGEQTICKHVRGARRIFAEAVNQDLIARNPFDRLRGRPRPAMKEWAYLDRGNMQRILDACPNDAWRAFWALLRYAGLRVGEAMRLRWVDVDFAGNRIIVNAAGTIDVATNKKRPRVLPIEPARCPSGLTAVLSRALADAPTGAVRVCQDLGKCQSRISKRSRQIVDAAGITRWAKVHHTLRKNAETDWANHYPQYVASEWAGHAIAVSDEHYLRVPEEFFEPAPARTEGSEL